MIFTLTGPIKKEEAGFSLPHEHILCDLRPSLVGCTKGEHYYEKMRLNNRYVVYSDPYLIEDNAFYLDEDVAVKELNFFKKSGGKTVFDCTTFFADYKTLKRISEKSKVNVVLWNCVYPLSLWSVATDAYRYSVVVWYR